MTRDRPRAAAQARRVQGGVRRRDAAPGGVPPNLDVASSPRDAARITDGLLHDDLASMVDDIDEADLSADRMYEMVVVNGFDALQRRADGTRELDLSFLEKYEVLPSCYPAGGRCVVSPRERRVVSVQNPGRPLVTPEHAAFPKEAFLFRTALFQWMTAVPHSTWCHGMVGPKLFLAVYETPEGHPIRTLFAPFVLDVHKNVARASFTVFGPNGVVFKAGGFSPKGVKELLDDGVRRFNVVLPTEMDLPDEIKGPILQAWDALLALCRDGFRELGVRDDDPAVRHFHDVLAKELHPRLGELPATDAAAACIFIGAVSHQVRVPRRGPLGAAGTDARARSAATALGAQLLRHQGPALRLDEVAAPAPRRGEHEGPDRDGGAHRQRRAPRVHHRVHAPRLRAPRRRPRPLHRRPPRQEGVRGVRAQDAAGAERGASGAALPRDRGEHDAVSGGGTERSGAERARSAYTTTRALNPSPRAYYVTMHRAPPPSGGDADEGRSRPSAPSVRRRSSTPSASPRPTRPRRPATSPHPRLLSTR